MQCGHFTVPIDEKEHPRDVDFTDSSHIAQNLLTLVNKLRDNKRLSRLPYAHLHLGH